MELYENIARLRAERGMSQSDLAEALDVSRQSVSKWETNASTPDLEKLVKLSELFGVTLDELVGRTPPPEPPAPEQTVVVVEQRQRLPGRYIAGAVLLVLAGVGFLWAVLQSDPLAGLLLAVLPVVCSVLCLKLEKPGLWCGWAVYDGAYLFCLLCTSANPVMIFRPIYYNRDWTGQLIIAWVLFVCYLAMLAWTVVRYRRSGPGRKWLPWAFWAGVVLIAVANRVLVQIVAAAGAFVAWGWGFQVLNFLQMLCFTAAVVSSAAAWRMKN